MNSNKLINTLEYGQAVLISGKANIYYYSGFTSEDAWLYISKEKKILITDSRYTVQAKEQAKDFEVTEEPISNVINNENASEILIEEDYLTVKEIENLKEKTKAKYICGQKIISAPRRIKSADEIEKIRKAEKLGDMAFNHILPFIKEGALERDIALELEFFMRKNGAESLSFETIVASGVRSCMPHGVASNKKIEIGDLITLDFGCILDNYCSDMTRTVALGRIGEKEKEIYDIVLKAQKEACAMIKAGMSCFDADKIARDIICGAGYGKCFGHSLGHSVGIEIHENPNLSPKSKDILEIGNVVSVEPGIYIDGFGGVRIEDVVAITENGCENLTASSKELIIL